ncbi:increased DNA methylation 1-like [Impatiens glandulifera]|uniref:increased DNA methylation 1-like n=1 Tax=Impatiens glandulifera TaxID=253017 RepID=UPI001FB18B3F|nr:increased DNA methylation 1-like [Impatiens glandulifera]
MPNGRNLRDVLNLCRDVPLQNIKSAVLTFIGCISKDPLPPKGILNESEDDCSSSVMGECNPPQILENSEPSEGVVIGSENEASLLVASPLPLPTLPPSLPVKKPPTGKLTKKDLRMHKLVFSEHVISDGTDVTYRVGKEDVLFGKKKGSAIVCSCCNKEYSPSMFENHAGRGTRRKPYLHIFALGRSLHELAVRALKTRIISDEDKDDICSICRGGDEVGGGLISCSSCPRVFHTVCQVLPANLNDGWHCRYCLNSFQTERCKRVVGKRDDGKRIVGKRVRGTSAPEADDGRPGGCTLCRKHYYVKKGFCPSTVMICDQCEMEYHVRCLKNHKMFDLKELPAGVWLCCTDCNIIYYALQNLIATGEVNLKESSLSLIRRKIGSETVARLDIKWRLLSGKITSDETRSLLSKSVSIFHDRFDPIEELRNGRKIDLIPNMVYGNKKTEGMYCAVLTVDSIVVCAGVFRIFGTHVAELPLVATSNAHEGLGYFQALLSCIEGLLASLKVKMIVLPAAAEAKSIWTNRFGFVEMSDIEEEQYRKQFQLLFFQGTRMLHKPVMEENVV